MIKKALLTFLFFFSFSAAIFSLEAPFDHSVFDQFLKQYVNENGEVNYAEAKKNPELLDRYLEILKNISYKEFQVWPREEKMALFMNAYHAGLLRKILDSYPISSVQKIPGFWQMDTIHIDKKPFGLNSLRKEYLLRDYRDAKIHMALSYSAQSGPRLSRDAFTGPHLEAQLFLAARRFVNDPQRNQIKPGKNKIYLAKIFEWHNLDFNLDFGAFENEKDLSQRDFAILSFIANYLEDSEKIEFLEEGNYKVKYLPFDWTLNDWKPGSEAPGQA